MPREKYMYLDNGTTTRTDPRVLKAMKPYFTEKYGIPGSELGHSFDLDAINALEESRKIIASSLNASPEEIIFTSGGTESNNMALIGAAEKAGRGKIITTKIEHSSLLGICKYLESKGFKVTYLNVNNEGFVDMEELGNSIDKETILVSIGHANNEVGTIQDMDETGRICRENDVPLHSDAVASYTKIPADVEKLGVSLLSITSHMIHGPKGVGALYAKKGTEIPSILKGGSQERNLRPGTYNIPCIVGFAKAVELVNDKELTRLEKLRDRLIKGLLEIPKSRLNGPVGKKRLPSNANVSMEYVEGEAMLLHMDMRGVAIGTGSACYSKQLKPSHVITAMGYDAEVAHGSVRAVVSRFTTEEEIDYAVENLAEVVDELRKISARGDENVL